MLLNSVTLKIKAIQRGRNGSSTLLTHVTAKSELILRSKRCQDFRKGATFLTGTIVRSLVLLEGQQGQGQANWLQFLPDQFILYGNQNE